jgi:protein disulfide-isomerase A1
VGPHNYKNYMDAGLPLLYLFIDLTLEGQEETYLPIIRPLAEQSKGVVNFVYIDWSKYAKHAERLGLSGNKVPAIAIEKIEDVIVSSL